LLIYAEFWAQPIIMPKQGALTSQHVDQFREILGSEYVLLDQETLEHFSHDETENLRFLPEVVVKPRTPEEISAILKICNQHLIPVTPRGAGTGLSGGALPHLGGVLLSTERLNKILEIDERNLQVVTEPGVITEVLQNAVKAKKLFYPPDPSSRGSCFIGGNVAENSGGPKAVKYGVVKDYVLNLEVVLPTGEIIWTGSVDDTAVPITEDTAAHLIIEVDGNDQDVLMREMEAIGELLTQYDIGEIYFAEDTTQKERLWKLRRRAAEAVKLVGYTIEEDTVVPRAELPTLIRELKALGKKHQVDVVCYGHAGDGNLHVRLRKEGTPNSYGDPEMKKILTELFEIVYRLGGTISAEHGIGLIQKDFMPIVFHAKSLDLMRSIKSVFDPNSILNAGKVI